METIKKLKHNILITVQKHEPIRSINISKAIGGNSGTVTSELCYMAAAEVPLIEVKDKKGIYSLTSAGREFIEAGYKVKKRIVKPKPKLVKNNPEPELNISSEAKSAVDVVGRLIEENAQLRTALTEIGDIIKILLQGKGNV